ncbi:MAG: exodeoxyribonuclease III [Oscillospiraceae bacterium]|nr:exodeoxyribonuclease III [Oscillospiraceae bacterium]
MKLISWNVNGLRACIKKGFLDSVALMDADAICLQEIKMERAQSEVVFEGYHEYWLSAEKKGYSGTAIFSKIEPVGAAYGMGVDRHDHEGRIITLDFGTFYLVNVYVPNSQNELARLPYRMEWEDDFREFALELDRKKPVIICGDLNCAHEEIDLKNPKTNERNAGFTIEERGKMTMLLEAGFTDFFRHFNPEARDAYTWWSYRAGARERNVGWRIDYFLGSDRLTGAVAGTGIYPDVQGSDHCPVWLDIDLIEIKKPRA